jgi:hypothetical protein
MSDKTAANESMLEIAVNAAAAGHDLSGFRSVNAIEGLPNGYEARCRKCGRTAWVGEDGLMYSLLDSECNKQ